ncbi:MAG: mechanosensitive ion channel [Bacteroidia bacterium]|nr:mechanosensitive ion channel [Bacteroidia bacterium]
MFSILDYQLINSKQFSLTVFDAGKVIFIILGAYIITSVFKKLLNKRAGKEEAGAEGRYHSLAQLFRYFIYVIAAFLILAVLGINLTVLTAGSAALLVGIGFGLQHTFNDFVSGIIILFEGTLQVGNIVEIESVVGRVKHIGLRTSRIETRDGVTIIVPNSKLVSDNVVNWSHQTTDRTRFYIRFTVGADTDIHKVKKILLEIAQGHKDVLDKPAPKVRFYDFNESGFVFDLLFWTSNMFFVETVKSDLRFMLVEEFRKNNVGISFPHRTIITSNQ